MRYNIINFLKSHLPYRKNIIILVGIIFLIIVLNLFPAIANLTQENIDLFAKKASSNPALMMFLFVALAAFSAMLSFFSSVIFVPVAIVAWGEFATAFLLLVGWLIGGLMAYFAAYLYGPPLVKKIIGDEKFNHHTEYLLTRSKLWMIILFRLTIPSEVADYLLGLIKYPFSRYILAAFITELPIAVVSSYAGNAFIKQDFFSVIFYATIAIIILALFGYFSRRKFKAYKTGK
ncbi:VTT domain-containing protein [Candidatus Wolfebacteria bacterium]|nr:VTT domain-containing protein [Candidatus Wolfebacteria bacterium]